LDISSSSVVLSQPSFLPFALLNLIGEEFLGSSAGVTLSLVAISQPSNNMPPKNPLWIRWITSPAWAIIMEDLERGGIIYQRENIPAEEIWEFYKTLPQFEKRLFSASFNKCA
jgi:hypothetical protein